MPDILDQMSAETDREWLKHVAGRLGVKPESLERVTKRPHVEYGDQFTEDQLKPLHHNGSRTSLPMADGRTPSRGS
jgi:hypothetical protein